MVQMSCAELNMVWDLKMRLDREQRRLQDLQVMAESMTPILDGMPHAKPLTYKVEQLATMTADCKDTIANLTEQLIQAKFDLLTKLQSLNLHERCERVLNYHYVSCLKFGAIAKLMNYTRDYVWKLHKRGLEFVGLTLEEMTNLRKQSKSLDVAICSA